MNSAWLKGGVRSQAPYMTLVKILEDDQRRRATRRGMMQQAIREGALLPRCVSDLLARKVERSSRLSVGRIRGATGLVSTLERKMLPVDVENVECPCRRAFRVQVTPCIHLLRLAREVNRAPESLMPSCLTVAGWEQQCGAAAEDEDFPPGDVAVELAGAALPPIRLLNLPLAKRPRGGQKRTRHKSCLERPQGQKSRRRTVTCSRCGRSGHNSRSGLCSLFTPSDMG